MKSLKSLRIAATVAIVLSFLVVLLGAFTRLTDAGLGCPDWPGCYGHMVLPQEPGLLAHAQSQFPSLPIESRKAWTEMVHRYAAGTLAVLIIVMCWSVVRFHQRVTPRLPRAIPLALVLLVMFQAALGMWTVTLKLLPIVVMGHLLGGLLIFACLCYWRLQLSTLTSCALVRCKLWINLGLALVFCQIALGGWVSSNYAGIACIGFPKCNGVWLSTLHLSEGFNLFAQNGTNYQGGVLEHAVRVTIQLAHRLGALVTATYVVILASTLWFRVQSKRIRCVAILALVLIFVQFLLGVANVIYLLPLWIAVAHNGVAALLLATMTSMRYFVSKGEGYAR